MCNKIVPNQDNCSVCLSNTGEFCITSCNHGFHEECLCRAIKTNQNKCPLCRDVIKFYKNKEIKIELSNPQLYTRISEESFISIYDDNAYEEKINEEEVIIVNDNSNKYLECICTCSLIILFSVIIFPFLAIYNVGKYASKYICKCLR